MDLDIDDPTHKYGSSNEGFSKSQAEVVPLLVPQPVMPVSTVSESGIIPKVHNVVSTVDVGCKLDLLQIALRLRNAEYNPKRFHAVVMRILEPRTAALIFRSGKIVVTGARSEAAAHLASRKYARLLQKLNFDVRFIDFKIQNMVASCDVKFPIQIEKLYSLHLQFCSSVATDDFFEMIMNNKKVNLINSEFSLCNQVCYEPELFPGLIYRMVKPRTVLLIFVSGKIVLTGGKSRDDLQQAFENIYPILKGFRKQ